jgi:hypothetical protein
VVHNSGLWDYFYTTMATEYYSGTLQTRQIDSIYSLIQAALWYVHKLKSIIGLNILLECMLVSTKYYPTQNNLQIDKPPFCWDMTRQKIWKIHNTIFQAKIRELAMIYGFVILYADLI